MKKSKNHALKNGRCSNCVAICKSAFKDLTPSQSGFIDKIRRPRTVLQGQKLSFASEYGEGFHCISSGHFRLNLRNSHNCRTVGISGPGDLIGYLQPDAYTAVALNDAKVCIIATQPFLELQKTVPEISNGVFQKLTESVAVKDARIAGLENHTVKNRVASTLLSLAAKFGATSAYGVLLDVGIDRKILAELSGTVIESLARTLTEMEEEQIIFRQGRRIHIKDMNKLNLIVKT